MRGLYAAITREFESGGPPGGWHPDESLDMRAAIAGCLDAMAHSTLIFAPHGPSYDRLVPGAHAPTGLSWAYENRTAAIRVPAGPPAARRIEHRVAGGDINPYLLVTAVLGAWANTLDSEVDVDVLAAVNKILYPEGVGRDICALIADDSPVSRTVASACLKREGIQVIEAEDGAEAALTAEAALAAGAANVDQDRRGRRGRRGRVGRRDSRQRGGRRLFYGDLGRHWIGRWPGRAAPRRLPRSRSAGNRCL